MYPHQLKLPFYKEAFFFSFFNANILKAGVSENPTILYVEQFSFPIAFSPLISGFLARFIPGLLITLKTTPEDHQNLDVAHLIRKQL